MIVKVLAIIEDEWLAVTVAVTTDCGGEARAARSLLIKQRPSLVGPDCYAHQIELVVHDYFKADTDIFVWTKQADEVICWLRSRNYLLALLLDIQKQLPGNHGPPKTVIRGVLTRWMSYYLAYRRLLELQPVLLMLANDSRIYLSGSADSHEKTRTMIPILRNGLLWHNVARIKMHLEPLAIAANISQSSSHRPDQVVITFAFLFKYFKGLTPQEDLPICTAVTKSLEKRWSKADQDVFIAAVILNPYLKLRPFRDLLAYFSNSAVGDLISRLWQRFYPTVPEPPLLYDSIKRYLASTGEYQLLQDTANRIHKSAEAQGKPPDPLDIWRDSIIAGTPIPPLHQIAIHVLSICPNAADCERLFSVLGFLMNDRRTRLSNSTLLNMAELRLHLRDEHVRKGVKARLKHHFGDRVPDPADIQQASAAPEDSSTSRQARRAEERREFRAGLEALTQSMSILDEEDEDRVPTWLPSKICVSLEQLFDFSNAFWTEWDNRYVTNTLEEELEIWNILDMDGDGEEDGGDGERMHDDLTDAILSS
ncbi:ribonuclease H-like domain-containing protein [Fomes fomentarius]|nr:ribonuclease H-like domain-containing protein [Fomes fomentarius]